MGTIASMEYEPIIIRSVDCECDYRRAAADHDRRISTHRTSTGTVTYHRCYCGFTGVTLWEPVRQRQAV